jgi:hypothetical protein
VLFFHFLSGVTPFVSNGDRDQTLENIILRKINWDVLPPECSAGARKVISDFLVLSRSSRLGHSGGDAVLHHEYFSDIDFENLYRNSGPFSISVQGEGDCRYFEPFEDKSGRMFEAMHQFVDAEEEHNHVFTSAADDEDPHNDFRLFSVNLR